MRPVTSGLSFRAQASEAADGIIAAGERPAAARAAEVEPAKRRV